MTNELADPPTLAETPPAIALDARGGRELLDPGALVMVRAFILYRDLLP